MNVADRWEKETKFPLHKKGCADSSPLLLLYVHVHVHVPVPDDDGDINGIP